MRGKYRKREKLWVAMGAVVDLQILFSRSAGHRKMRACVLRVQAK
jgi:hypothetical protein